MRHAELHNGVNLFYASYAFLQRKNCFVDHRHQYPIRYETRIIVYDTWSLTEVRRKMVDGVSDSNISGIAIDDLHQFHYRHWIHEVHAYHFARALSERAYPCDRD